MSGKAELVGKGRVPASPSSSSSVTDKSLLACPTAKLLATVLDGASERAVLLSHDGTLLHLNTAAQRFLSHEHDHVTDFLADASVDDDSWKTMTRSHIVMISGKTTRTERNIHVVELDHPTSCCNRNGNADTTTQEPLERRTPQYYTAYICSKHERVREIVDHALDPVLTADETGKICTVNEAATALFGYSEQEMVGQNIAMICGGGHAVHHNQYMQHYMETGVAKIIGKKREVTARKRNGTEFPVELGVQEISDVSSGKRYFCGFLKDLSKLKQHEAEIAEKQALAQAMINASFDSMLEIDQAGIIQLVNDAACNMFGYTRDEFLGSNISMICGGDHGDKHDAYMARYLEHGGRRVIGTKRQVQALRKDGSEFTVELAVQEVTLSTGKKAFCGYLRDMSAQLHAKRTLRKQQQMIHGKFFGTSPETGGGEDI